MKKKYTLQEFGDSFDPKYARQGILRHVKDGNLPAESVGRGFIINISNKHVKAWIDNCERKFTPIKEKKKPVKVPAKKKPDKVKFVKVKKPKPAKKPKPVKVKKAKPAKKPKPVNPTVKKDTKPQKYDIPKSLLKRLDEGKLTATDLIGLPKVIVEKIKIYEQTKQVIQKRLQERKELISIKFVHLLFGKIYDIDVNEFMAIKTRVKSQLAKIFKTNDDAKLLAAEKAIDEELWDTLRRVKYEFDKFLDKNNFKL